MDKRVIPWPTIDATAVDMKLKWSVKAVINRTVKPPAFVGCVGPVTKTLAYVQLEWNSPTVRSISACEYVDVVDARACLNSEGSPCVRERVSCLCLEEIV